MKLYISTKLMTFNEEENLIEHKIILRIRDKEFYGYDRLIELPDDDKFIKDALRTFYKKDKEGKDTREIDHIEFIVSEQKTWNSFPLYEIVDGKIIPFDHSRYSYFLGTDRRMVLASKINGLYNQSSEFKILRKTLKIILDKLNIEYPEFEKYNQKVYNIINRFPKKDK